MNAASRSDEFLWRHNATRRIRQDVGGTPQGTGPTSFGDQARAKVRARHVRLAFV